MIIPARRRRSIKPAGPASNAVDFSLVPALQAAFLLNEPGPGPREIITGRKASGAFGDNGSTIRYMEKDAKYGQGVFVDGSYVTWQSSTHALDLSAEFSVFWGGKYQTRDTSNAFFWGLFNSARTSSISAYSAGGVLRSVLHTTAHSFTSAGSDTLYDGKRIDSCLTFSNAATALMWYINGRPIAQVTSTATPANFGAAWYLTIGASIDLNTGESFDGTTGYVYILNKRATPSDVYAFDTDYLLPLRRRRSVIMLPSAAAGPSVPLMGAIVL